MKQDVDNLLIGIGERIRIFTERMDDEIIKGSILRLLEEEDFNFETYDKIMLLLAKYKRMQNSMNEMYLCKRLDEWENEICKKIEDKIQEAQLLLHSIYRLTGLLYVPTEFMEFYSRCKYHDIKTKIKLELNRAVVLDEEHTVFLNDLKGKYKELINSITSNLKLYIKESFERSGNSSEEKNHVDEVDN